jgi:hypothetical protein
MLLCKKKKKKSLFLFLVSALEPEFVIYMYVHNMATTVPINAHSMVDIVIIHTDFLPFILWLEAKTNVIAK